MLPFFAGAATTGSGRAAGSKRPLAAGGVSAGFGHQYHVPRAAMASRAARPPAPTATSGDAARAAVGVVRRDRRRQGSWYQDSCGQVVVKGHGIVRVHGLSLRQSCNHLLSGRAGDAPAARASACACGDAGSWMARQAAEVPLNYSTPEERCNSRTRWWLPGSGYSQSATALVEPRLARGVDEACSAPPRVRSRSRSDA